MLRSSLFDHIYVKNVELIQNFSHVKPCFGDHELIMAYCNIVRPEPKMTQRRDWRHYSKETLNEKLCLVDWSNNACTVQEAWDDLECKIVTVVDSLVPISEFYGNHLAYKTCPIIILN